MKKTVLSVLKFHFDKIRVPTGRFFQDFESFSKTYKGFIVFIQAVYR